MKLKKEFFEEGLKCPSCNYETHTAFSLDGEKWLCGNCTADLISEEYLVADRHFDPANFPDIYFPNWYYREDLEDIYGEKIADEKWERLKRELDNSGVPDEVSEIVYRYLPDLKDIKGEEL